MYPVTSAYKNAIYSSSREIKAKTIFEIIDVTAHQDATTSINQESEFSKYQQTVNLKKQTSSKYATFETNYWKLDGTYCLPPLATETGYEVGWWSNTLSGVGGVFSSYPTLTVDFTKDHTSIGTTVTFDTLTNEYASDFTIQAYDSSNVLIETINVTNNTNAKYISDTGIANYRKIVLTITKWKTENRRSRVLELDFGIVAEYDNEKIVTLNVLNELDPLSSTVSANELTLTLYNENQEFNILNPNGIYPYLQRRQRIIPSYGLVINENTTEYIPMGVYYLNDWKSDEGAQTATFTARDVMDLLSSSKYRLGEYGTNTLYDIAESILQDAGIIDYSIDSSLNTITTTGYVPILSHKDALQLVVFAGQCVLTSDRDGFIRITRLSNVPSTEIIDFDNAYKSPSIQLDKLVNTIDVNVNKYVPKTTSEEIYNGILPINGTSNVWIEYKQHPCTSVNVVVTGGTLNAVDYYANAAKLNITASGNVTIVATGIILEKASSLYQLLDPTAPQDEQLLSLSVDNVLITDTTMASDIAAWILNEYKSRYLYEINWRQNPSYDAGDIVIVQDEFDENKAIRIYKQNYEYSGYLTGKTNGKGG